jgi:signal transduction histidine kinase
MKTILLIDDEENLRSIFGKSLQENGYRVIEAASGEAGLELARQQLPDLILSDISMPGMSGQDVLKQIRQDPELSGKQVILMTGDARIVTPRRAMEEGADDFLLKPINLDALLRCVEARLKRSQTHWRVEDSVLSRLQSSQHSNLPHEFFTPLAGIIGLTDVLQSGFSELSAEEIQDLLKDIRDSALRLHRTVRNYLLILDLEAASHETRPAPAPLSPKALEENVLAGAEEAVHRNNRMEDVSVRVDECSVLVNPRDLNLIVEELVDNACKFSRQGIPIVIRFGADGVLTVTDGGRGMPPEEIKQIRAFRQFDRKKHEQQGLGLGLFLAQKLTAQNGASLAIESAAAQGTQVKVAFQINNSGSTSPDFKKSNENATAHSPSGR